MPSDTIEDMFSSEELYLAYRKAKADLFFERSLPTAKAFALYENDLAGNLSKLQSRLYSPSGNPWWSDLSFVGGVTFVPKSLTLPETEKGAPLFFASNAEDNWERIFELSHRGIGKIEAEFRPMASFTVDMHVVCALWIAHVGQLLDACLDQSAFGSRLRRIAGTTAYHRTVWQSFEPYFRSYKKWRDNGFNAIRRELNAGNKVVALTLDFRRFFHMIDPEFLLDERFHSILPRRPGGEPLLGDAQIAFTRALVASFVQWGTAVPGHSPDLPAGLPVGASASRVIANVVLLHFDRMIQKYLLPVYYARYVDDIFLVIRDTGHFRTGSDVLEWVEHRMNGLITRIPNSEESLLAVQLEYARRSRIEFQASKQRVFLIDNADLLDAIKSKVDEVSSEWRLLPDLKQMERSAAARALSTSRDGTSDGDALRKTDTLLLKRLGFAILLRNVDATSRALPPKEWKAKRIEFYEFAMRHVIAPDKLFELADYLPRLVAVAVTCGDWAYAKGFVTAVIRLFTRIRRSAKLKYMEVPQTGDTENRIWSGVFSHIRAIFEETVLKSLRPSTGAVTMDPKNWTRKLGRISVVRFWRRECRGNGSHTA